MIMLQVVVVYRAVTAPARVRTKPVTTRGVGTALKSPPRDKMVTMDRTILAQRSPPRRVNAAQHWSTVSRITSPMLTANSVGLVLLLTHGHYDGRDDSGNECAGKPEVS